MASNDNWAPLPQRKNGNNKKNRENQAKVIRHLTEMFGATFEYEIIASVAQTCNWQVESSADTLLTLSASAQAPKSSSSDNFPAYDPWAADPYSVAEDMEPMFDSASSEQQVESKAPMEQKVETASLCGLKVEYRPKGMENISDDDADVVIEEESSDYRLGTPEPVQRSVNVCQFLETPTVQCPPRNTLTKVNYINTASPPHSPARNLTNSNGNDSAKLSSAQARIESDIRNGYKVLVLMRGCPGSGKSYLARDIVVRMYGKGSDFSNFIFSADDYFSLINRGVYVFDATKLQDAHAFNQDRVLKAVRQGWSPVIIDNTNTQVWEMQNYAKMGVDNGYIIETLEPNTPWFRSASELERRNKHNVPKSKIRMMLDRYEPNLTGDKLLKIYKLTYKASNQPPQMRTLPPLPEPVPQKTVATPQRQPRRVKAALEDMSQHVYNALSTIAKEYSNLETVATPPKLVSTNIEISPDDSNIKQPNGENWTDGCSYKENSLLDLTKLGAIGSERRVSNVGINTSNNQNEKTIVDANKEEVDLITLDPVDTQQEECLKKDEEVSSTDNGFSQCWDFTLLLNGVQIHSKSDDEVLDAATSEPLKTDVEAIESNLIEEAHDTHTSEKSKTDEEPIVQPESSEISEEPKIDDNSKEPQLSPSDSSSSSMGSLERVDMSQFEMCGNLAVTEDKPSSTVGLGSIFNFIKNSFLGNEKDKRTSKESEDDEESSSTDKLTAKLRESSVKYTSPILSSVFHDVSADTLSSKLSNSSTDGDNKNLNFEVQESSTLAGTELVLELSGESDEFFEAPESLPSSKPTERVVEELLEASSDFQLVEQSDEFVVKTRGNDKKDGKFVSEKNFIEQIKNLQVLVKFEEEDSKVLKEPIDRVFGGKNVFTEKMQNTSGSHALTPKPNNSISNAIIDNVNLISWQESPFPLDDVADTTLKVEADTTNIIETHDKCISTDPYDFNVAFVGGTDDYKILRAFSRSINDPNVPTSDESPSHGKLLLHKGTMTSKTSVLLSGERLFELEIQPGEEASKYDQSEELVERYPQLPRACVLDVYENCQRDFNWALDYLDSLQYDQATVSAAVEQHIAEAEVEAAGLSVKPQSKTVEVPTVRPARTSESESSSSLSSSPQRQRGGRKEKSAASSNAHLELKRQFEDKFVLSEESYKPHTLKVKRWKNRESKMTEKTSVEKENVPAVKLNEAVVNVGNPQLKQTRLDHPAVEDEVDNEEEEEIESIEDEPEETIELKLGYEFIRILEEQFSSGGAGNFQPPDGLFPVIQIRKSMAQELHALWVESMERQLNFMHEQLDAMIARDAEYARSLEQEEARAMPQPEEPNLKEIMDMEMALATYNNDRVSPHIKIRKRKKQKLKKESVKDMTSRVTERTLHDMFPDYEREMLHEIYVAHNRDFDETVRVIQENCSGKSTLTMADMLKKRKTLIDELQKESTYQTSRYNQLEGRNEASGGSYEEDEDESVSYEEAIKIAQDSRYEARRQLELRNENFQKALAFRKKNPEVAAYYADMAKLHVKNMEQAHEKAASAYLAAQAYTHESEDTLDLHHLRVEEALRALDIFIDHQLDNMSKGSRKYIYVITGRGARSVNGQSRIKPAVAFKLNQKNINFEEENPGMLKVCLRKK